MATEPVAVRIVGEDDGATSTIQRVSNALKSFAVHAAEIAATHVAVELALAKLKRHGPDITATLQRMAASGSLTAGAMLRVAAALERVGAAQARARAGLAIAGGFLRRLLPVAAAAVAIRQLERMTVGLVEFGEAGARIEPLTLAFERLTAGTGGAEQTMSRLKDATRGAVTQMELMRLSALALNTHTVTTQDQLVELARGARTLGQIFGIETGHALENLVRGIALRNTRLLKSVGILVSIEHAERQYAAALGLTSAQLTPTQQKAALLHAVLEEIRASEARMGVATTNLAFELDRVSTAKAEFVQRLREGVGASQEMARGVGLLADAMVRLERAASRAKPAITIATDEFFRTIQGQGLALPTPFGLAERLREAVSRRIAGPTIEEVIAEIRAERAGLGPAISAEQFTALAAPASLRLPSRPPAPPRLSPFDFGAALPRPTPRASSAPELSLEQARQQAQVLADLQQIGVDRTRELRELLGRVDESIRDLGPAIEDSVLLPWRQVRQAIADALAQPVIDAARERIRLAANDMERMERALDDVMRQLPTFRDTLGGIAPEAGFRALVERAEADIGRLPRLELPAIQASPETERIRRARAVVERAREFGLRPSAMTAAERAEFEAAIETLREYREAQEEVTRALEGARISIEALMGAAGVAANVAVGLARGTTTPLGAAGSLAGAAAGLFSGPLGVALGAASIGLGVADALFGRDSREREDEMFRAHLRALRQAAEEQIIDVTIVLPDTLDPQNPLVQERLGETVEAIARGRKTRVRFESRAGAGRF